MQLVILAHTTTMLVPLIICLCSTPIIAGGGFVPGALALHNLGLDSSAEPSLPAHDGKDPFGTRLHLHQSSDSLRPPPAPGGSSSARPSLVDGHSNNSGGARSDDGDDGSNPGGSYFD